MVTHSAAQERSFTATKLQLIEIKAAVSSVYVVEKLLKLQLHGNAV